MTVREHAEPDAWVIEVRGEIDIASTPELSTRLNVAVHRTSGAVVVDLSRAELIDSSGIASLLNALRRMTRARRRMALVCPGGAVLRALRIARLDTTFTICDSRREALRQVRPAAPAAVA